jgi:hypothetical protein
MTRDFDIGLGGVPDPFAGTVADAVLPPPPRPTSASPSRKRHRTLGLAAAGAAILYEGAALAVFRTRPDLATAHVALVALENALPLFLGAIVLVAATWKGSRGLGQSVGALMAWVFGAPLLFVLATLAIFPTDLVDGVFWSRTETCCLVAAVLGAGPLGLGALALRRSFVSAAGWRAAAVGVAAGALAASAMALVCPDDGAMHVLLGHGTMMLVMGLIGAGIVRRVTRI